MGTKASNQRGGRAYIGRDPLGDSFGGYLASRDEREVVEEGDPWETVEEALVWARQRAREVVLTYGWEEGDRFSAGADPVLGLPSWPPSDERRKAIDEAVARTVANAPLTPDKIGVLCAQIRGNPAQA